MNENIKKDNTYCCVPQCKSAGSKNPDLSFHKFPNVNLLGDLGKMNKKRKVEWIIVLKIGKNVTERMRVCSKHFKKDDYILPGVSTKRPQLKRTAIPSLYLPVLPSDNVDVMNEKKKKAEQRAERYMSRMSPCSAFGCLNAFSKHIPGVTFHSFPFRRPDTLRKWITAMRRKNWYPTKASSICSDHFLPEDFQPQLPGCTAKRLKPDAVPSKFNFSPITSKKLNKPKNSNPQKKGKQIHKSEGVINESSSFSTEGIKKEIPDIYSPSLATNISFLNEDELNQSPINREICENTKLQISCKMECKNTSDSEEGMEENLQESTNSSDESSSEDSNLEPLSSEEILQRKLEIMTALYEKSQKKLKLCQEQCKLYVKQVIALEEVIDNLKQINSVTDYS